MPVDFAPGCTLLGKVLIHTKSNYKWHLFLTVCPMIVRHSLIRQAGQESYLTGQKQINLSAQDHMLMVYREEKTATCNHVRRRTVLAPETWLCQAPLCAGKDSNYFFKYLLRFWRISIER